MRFEHEAAPVGVDQRVALASVNLLARIVTAWPAGLGSLDGLASLSRRMMSSASFAKRLLLDPHGARASLRGRRLAAT
jgi:hypothetical protein